MALAPRSEKPLHDQIIDHDLVNVASDQIPKLILIELRRIREVLYVLNEPPPDEK